MLAKEEEEKSKGKKNIFYIFVCLKCEGKEATEKQFLS